VLQDLEHRFERVLFASRWLLAPLYMGMVLALLEILVVFARELFTQIPHILELDGEHAILLALSLIDLSLTGNLVLIVIFAGYENFVSRINLSRDKDRPRWMGTVDFSDLKIKLVASIVAISAIALLRAFLPLADEDARPNGARLGWMVAIHLTFVVSGVLLAVMDHIAHKSARGKAAHDRLRAADDVVRTQPLPTGPVTRGE
jgi:uncharacterized protein (TIGR00645 family)